MKNKLINLELHNLDKTNGKKICTNRVYSDINGDFALPKTIKGMAIVIKSITFFNDKQKCIHINYKEVSKCE